MESILFASKKKATAQKLKGAYYTPQLICDFIAHWLDEETTSILESSCGDGNFLASFYERFAGQIPTTAVEMEAEEIDEVGR